MSGKLHLPRLRSSDQLLHWADDLVQVLERGGSNVHSILDAVAGDNNNVNLKGANLGVILSVGGAFNITGIAGGMVGRSVMIYNSTSQNMKILHESVLSEDTNRIRTMSGATVTLNGESMAWFIWVRGRWLLFSTTF